MVDIISKSDLPADVVNSVDPTLLDTLIAGLNARALRVAPCLADNPDPGKLAEAKLILIGTIKRWSETGAGALQSETVGPYSVQVDTRQRGGYTLWRSEITDLQGICSGDKGGAFSVDTVPAIGRAMHADICSINFGTSWCSCGADLTGSGPLWESS